MQHRKQVIAVCIPGVALSAMLAVWQGVQQSYPSPQISLLAWGICACYAGILLLAAWEELRWLGRGVFSLPAKVKGRRAVTPAGSGQRQTESAPAPDWQKLPVVAIPFVRTARDSVIAFAQKHGLRPFETDTGFVLADSSGHYYRAVINS